VGEIGRVEWVGGLGGGWVHPNVLTYEGLGSIWGWEGGWGIGRMRMK